MESTKDSSVSPASQLSAWDAASVLVGIVIGTTIFQAPGMIASQTSSPLVLLGLWVLGGGLAFLGALCYAELGATYPGPGGDYQYLTRAFGPWAGFLFWWTQLVVVQTVNIAMFAYVFAKYAWKLVPSDQGFANVSVTTSPILLIVTAASCVVVVTAINLLGLRTGSRTQNVLTYAKILGIGLLLFAAICAPGSPSVSREPATSGDWTVALILILYSYGGWNDAAFIVNEIRDPQRNVPRALLGGVSFVALVYLAVNLGYIFRLGFSGLQHADNPPVVLMTSWWGDAGGRALSALVMISALGAVNGLIFSVSRLHAAVGNDHRLFVQLSRWGKRQNAPEGALVIQACLTIALLFLVGTSTGQTLLDGIYRVFTGQVLPWHDPRFPTGFELLFAVGAPVFWLFFLSTGVAYFVLRQRDVDLERPFRTPLYPLPPLLFCLMCLFGLWASVRFAGGFTWLGVVPVLVGGGIYLLDWMLGPRAVKSQR